MKTLSALKVGILLLLLSASAPQDARAQGEKLTLTGTFLAADTVQIKVYHDTYMVDQSQEVYSYAIELMNEKSYIISFTDTKGREKRIWIPYTGDGLIELAEPIDVDFNAVGDIAMIKENARKPGFLIIDVGLLRRKKR